MRMHTNMQPGERHGSLVVIDPDVSRLKAWVRCDCGVEKAIRRDVLRARVTVSCGCVRRGNMILRGESRRTHGLSSHPLWGIWQQRRLACESPAHPSYKLYGAKGVKMHEPWARDFALFLRDIGEPPPGMRLTRKDRAGDFVPGNVCWTAKKRSGW
jgi:hypothetical protein